jgi:serine phosphatase RsbU (regulator of sigma subunit)
MINTKLNILLVEDSESDSDLLIRFLKKKEISFSYSRVWARDAFLSAIKGGHIDLIIADHSLPQFSGMEAFRIARMQHINVPFILLTGTVTENVLTEYAKEGIDDYILKDNLLRLPSAIKHVIQKKKNEELLEKLEIAHKSIQDSINYSKVIQNAMLSDTSVFDREFPESFGLFMPRDVLSGDFYWLKEEGNTFYIAAADCTGHGIPGALMSMIGIEKLNNMMLKDMTPSEILNKLNQSISKALSQSTQHDHSQDGMDLALCSVNKEKHILQFAGANRPLWIIRSGQKEIEEVKGTKKAIGGVNLNRCKDFENHEIQLYKGDTFYIFTDGFADQFGGEKGKKMTSKKFKKLLTEIQYIAMNHQEDYLISYIEDWKTEKEQVDDILIIGVRVDW